MDSRVKELIKQSDSMFSDRRPLLDLWQEIAENFYPERADFTVNRRVGTEFNEQNMTSYPIFARRELGDNFGSMLRPRNIEWFKASTTREERHDHSAKMWLEDKTKVQRRAMYDRKARFANATKEGDHDFATFGQCVLDVDVNRNDPRLIFQTHHLRDIAWADDAYGANERVDRDWSPTISMAMRMFGGKNHQKVKDAYAKEPNAKIKMKRIVLRAELYRQDMENPRQHGWVSIWVDAENSHLLEEVPIPDSPYVLPRWQTVSGSQYAYSPATVIALPDARLIQSMTRVLLEAGEKAVDPPMIAVEEAIREDIGLYAGGITWVDAEYDERLGDVLRPIRQDKTNFGYGIELRRDVQNMITEAFYLNKLSLPQRGPEMTAYEVGQRVQEYIRQALPLFEPMESEYNGSLCEKTFDILLRNGAFGSVEDIPKSLQGADIEFKFESPLHEAIEQQKGQKFHEAGELLARAAEIDPKVASNVDINTSFRDAFSGIGAPENWLVDENVAADIRAKEMEAQAQQRQMEAVEQAGVAAKEVATAEETAARVPS